MSEFVISLKKYKTLSAFDRVEEKSQIPNIRN